MYKLRFAKQADKTFHKLPRNLANRMRHKILQIVADPHAHHTNVKKLKDHPGFRLRVGDWRIIYLIQDDEMIVYVLKIASRGQVYR